VAETQSLALHAVSKVTVEYSNVSSPHLNMRHIISSGDKTRIRVEKEPDAADGDGKLKCSYYGFSSCYSTVNFYSLRIALLFLGQSILIFKSTIVRTQSE
jgi:hypothetical protein